MGVVIGLDIGQKRDPTAICVSESERRYIANGSREYHFLIRHLERLPLGTSYPDVANRLGEISRGVARRTERWPTAYVDATGLGDPIVGLLKAQARRVRAVYFNYGDRRTEEGNDEIRLGKAWLVARLQALLQTGRLHLPKSAEAEALARDLLDYEIRVEVDANERYGAFRVGARDDLVTALGLAVQLDPPGPSFAQVPLLIG